MVNVNKIEIFKLNFKLFICNKWEKEKKEKKNISFLIVIARNSSNFTKSTKRSAFSYRVDIIPKKYVVVLFKVFFMCRNGTYITKEYKYVHLISIFVSGEIVRYISKLVNI